MRRRADRQFFVVIAGVFLVSCLGMGYAVWSLSRPWVDDLPISVVAAAVGGVLGGAILIGLAIAELVHRLRNGAQEPGRHASP